MTLVDEDVMFVGKTGGIVLLKCLYSRCVLYTFMYKKVMGEFEEIQRKMYGVFQC